MQKSPSKELFERISHLSNTLKLETIQLVNKASTPIQPEPCDSSSDTSVIVIDCPYDVENNPFVKILRENQSSLKQYKNEIEENCQKSCSKVSLEDLVNLSVFLHLTIEESIELIGKRLKMDPHEIEGFKSPLSDFIPVSLFQSNLRDKALKMNNSDLKSSELANSSKSEESESQKGLIVQDSSGDNSNMFKGSISPDIPKNPIKELNLEVYNFKRVNGKLKDSHPSDLKNLGLSEETRRLLGLES